MARFRVRGRWGIGDSSAEARSFPRIGVPACRYSDSWPCRNARDEAEAHQGAHAQWRTNVFPSDVLAELWTAGQFEAVAHYVRAKDLATSVRISADPERHLAWLEQDVAFGVSQINVHNVNRGQEAFIDMFNIHVLPRLRKA